MRKAFIGLLTLGAATVVGVAPASAGIPIPCTGETLVKVLDIPALAGIEVPANRTMATKRLDLGWKFTGCSGGEWIGHIGSNSSYVSLDAERLTMLLGAAGLTEPPPVPSFWSTSSNYGPVLLWGGIGILAVFGTLAQKRRDGAETSDRIDPAQSRAIAHPEAMQGLPPRYAAAMTAVDRAAEQRRHVATAHPSAPMSRPGRQVAGFGRRATR